MARIDGVKIASFIRSLTQNTGSYNVDKMWECSSRYVSALVFPSDFLIGYIDTTPLPSCNAIKELGFNFYIIIHLFLSCVGIAHEKPPAASAVCQGDDIHYPITARNWCSQPIAGFQITKPQLGRCRSVIIRQ